MTQMPPTPPVPGSASPGAGLKPHRGVVVLVLGILGLVVCPICGIIAWVMGKGDLPEMEAGRMDPSGMGLTKAGKICGMIAVILAIVGICFWIMFVVCFAVAGTASLESGL